MREKLIDLLGDDVCKGCYCEDCEHENNEKACIEHIKSKMADHLIANGVALDNQVSSSKWIPVSERLPEVVDTYIVVVKCKYDWEKEYEIGVDVATYDPYSGNPYIDGCWHTYNDWNEGQEYIHVTHWMPLPEPPREDQ